MTQKPKFTLPPSQVPVAILAFLLAALTGATGYLTLHYPDWCVAYSQSKGYHILLTANECPKR